MQVTWVDFFFIICFTSVRANTVQIEQGTLEGTTLTARNGRVFNAYYAIPFARAPVGSLRFQPPQPADKWNGTLNATAPGPQCPQVNTMERFSGNEDCLHLNVYTPLDAKPGDNVPVIVSIFGGAFIHGFAERDGPRCIMGKDIVHVAISYRLGVLGFLSTGDSVVPGNMALKDQRMALLWIKENIRRFGGDPNRVTLQGHSSGGACVHYHTLSSLSKGLYNRVITMSGLATAPQMFVDREYARGVAKELARRVNCTVVSSQELVNCLVAQNLQNLIQTAHQMKIWGMHPASAFMPTAEPEDVENAFFTELPMLAPYPSTSEPWLIGMTTGEAISYMDDFNNYTDPTLMPDFVFKYLAPIMGFFLWTSKTSYVNYLAQIIKSHFFGNGDIGPCTGVIQMLNGIMHGLPLLNVLEKYNGTKYLYLYDYEANTSKPMRFCGKYQGISHGEEVNVLFDVADKGESDEDYAFGDEFITRWVNFAYSGNPNEPFPIKTEVFGSWSPTTPSRMEYLLMKEGGSMRADDYFRVKYEFWRKLPFFSNVHR